MRRLHTLYICAAITFGGGVALITPALSGEASKVVRMSCTEYNQRTGSDVDCTARPEVITTTTSMAREARMNKREECRKAVKVRFPAKYCGAVDVWDLEFDMSCHDALDACDGIDAAKERAEALARAEAAAAARAAALAAIGAGVPAVQGSGRDGWN